MLEAQSRSDGGNLAQGEAAAYASALEPWTGAIDGEALLRAAEAVTGLSDWGGRRWNEERFRHDDQIRQKAHPAIQLLPGGGQVVEGEQPDEEAGSETGHGHTAHAGH